MTRRPLLLEKPLLGLAVLGLGLVVATAPLASAQSPADGPTPQASSTPRNPDAELSRLESVRAVNEQLLQLDRDVADHKLRSASATGQDLVELKATIEALEARREELRKSFAAVATGIPASSLDGDLTALTLEAQVRDLVAPIVNELKEMTARPRQLERLRSQIARLEEKRPKLTRALTALAEIKAVAQDRELATRVAKIEAVWLGHSKDLENELFVARVQLRELERSSESISTIATDAARTFFRSRGKNLLFALLAAVLGFFAVRLVHRGVRRASPLHKGTLSFGARLIDLVFVLLAGVFAALGAVGVLYVSGDWLLLSVVIVLVLAAVWAGRTVIPQSWANIRLMLNVGPVREGERLVYEGIPWRVARLGLRAFLVNPSLPGCWLRLPLAKLADLTSRGTVMGEPWFPTKRDDWVVLGGGEYGRVTSQTHEWVVVESAEGQRAIAASDFIGSVPLNLSCASGFRVATTFGIGYGHQADATGAIPEQLLPAVEHGLKSEPWAAEVKQVVVEFASAGASSLDLVVFCDLAPEAARHYPRIRRALQTIVTECCTMNGWDIPFAQVVVHAAPGGPAPSDPALAGAVGAV